MKEINVIMASYLGVYPRCASNREMKFIRAVHSFLLQSYKNKTLTIVSDGCDITNKLYNEHFSMYENVKLIQLPKQPLFSGNVRQAGIDSITNRESIICYLDSDDMFIGNHLENIVSCFGDCDLVYYDDMLNTNPQKPRKVELKLNHVGTSSIAHLNKYSWKDCDGYGHDWKFVNKIIQSKAKMKKISSHGYLVCHTPNSIDN